MLECTLALLNHTALPGDPHTPPTEGLEFMREEPLTWLHFVALFAVPADRAVSFPAQLHDPATQGPLHLELHTCLGCLHPVWP